jgi:hypothetical protein
LPAIHVELADNRGHPLIQLTVLIHFK